MPLRLVVALLFLALLWGSAFPVIKLALSGLSVVDLTLARHLIASLAFVCYLAFTRKRLWPARSDIGYFLLLGFIGITVYHLALNYGELYVSAGATSLIIATAPAITAVLAFFFLAERLPLCGWVGIAVSFAGVGLIVLGDGSAVGFNPYALFILLSALATSIFFVMQRPVLARYRAVEVVAFSTWAGTLPLLVFGGGLGEGVRAASATALWATVYLGLFPSALAYTLFTFGLSQAPVAVVSSFLYSAPVFSLLLSWWLLGETPTLLMLLGGLVALVGIVVVGRARRWQARVLAQAPRAA